ncbi:MAG: hypothetical protein M1376_02695 [Planctomycetes bacterium]|nr:hypothetical protein [Planctomycetota bacterium]
MRTPAIVLAAIMLSTTSAAWAQGWVAPPTRVGEVGHYTCPDHPQIQATWPARCPLCGMVLTAARGSSGAAGATTGMRTTGRASARAGALSPEAMGRAEGGSRSEAGPFGGREFEDRRSEQFRQTPEQQFRRQFPQTPEQQFRRQFPQTPEQRFLRRFPETPEQQFQRQFPETPEQRFLRQFPQAPRPQFRRPFTDQ